MIRNRNMVFQKANDASREEDRVLRLPVTTDNTGSAPTASTDINGAIYFDEENDVIMVCVAGAWKTITHT